MKNLIVGLVGTIGAGKTTVAKKLEQDGFVNLRLSVALEKEILAQGLPLVRINYQTTADRLREEKGADYLSRILITEIEKHPQSSKFVIDGFRNTGEIKPFREKGNFLLIGVDAPLEVRYQRLVDKKNSRSPKNWEDFIKQEVRDNGEGEPAWGQHISACLGEADFIVDSNRAEKLVYTDVEKIINNFSPS